MITLLKTIANVGGFRPLTPETGVRFPLGLLSRIATKPFKTNSLIKLRDDFLFENQAKNRVNFGLTFNRGNSKGSFLQDFPFLRLGGPMLCYQNKTFCVLDDCRKARDCPDSFTETVKSGVIASGLLVAIGKFHKCFETENRVKQWDKWNHHWSEPYEKRKKLYKYR